jgi:hypothetical protein
LLPDGFGMRCHSRHTNFVLKKLRTRRDRVSGVTMRATVTGKAGQRLALDGQLIANCCHAARSCHRSSPDGRPAKPVQLRGADSRFT